MRWFAFATRWQGDFHMHAYLGRLDLSSAKFGQMPDLGNLTAEMQPQVMLSGPTTVLQTSHHTKCGKVADDLVRRVLMGALLPDKAQVVAHDGITGARPSC